MSFNHMMHPRNRYKEHPPDFKELATKFPEFRQHCTYNSNGKVFVNFRSDEAVRSLTRAILFNDFQLDVSLPKGSLVPRVPQRLNYVLWIEDLLRLNNLDTFVNGIDIGTGASCIYALLGVRVCGWRFVVTDADPKSIKIAAENVQRNDLSSEISVFKVQQDDMIKDVVRGFPDVQFTFCMCNPPFFEKDESDQKFLFVPSAGGLTNFCGIECEDPRAPPKSSTVARHNELAVEGGEVAFINRIIDDSIVLQTAVRMYTTMVGKKSSVTALRKRLSRLVGARFAINTLNQGRTQRWVLAWTFCPEVMLEKKDDSYSCSFLSFPADVPFPLEWIRHQFNGLLIDVYCRDDHSIECEARRNTWSRQRQKKRGTKGGIEEAPDEKKARLSYCDAATQVCMGEGDGKDSFTDAGNFVDCQRTNVDRCHSHCEVQAYFPSEGSTLLQARFSVHSQDTHSLTFTFKEGSKQSMQQIIQYLKNQLKFLEKSRISSFPT